MELDNNTYSIQCRECGRDAQRHDWEAVEGGSINMHWSECCAHCGYADGDCDSSLEPATAVSGAGRAEWMTQADLMALAKGQPCQVKP
ncbi:hypothetical protein XaFJ1_GM000013 (plasmid) [Xanthomonas albilineans]|nr:hypothetical protein XaFJ1_GM000013 [Xanthomonas albilineans]